LRATVVARTPELDLRWAVLAEERCWSSRAALACVLAPLIDDRREPWGDRESLSKAAARRSI
jgi:hypothetical protein